MKITSSMVYEATPESRELLNFILNSDEINVIYIQPSLTHLKMRYTSGKFTKDKGIEMFYKVASESAEVYEKKYGSKNWKFSTQQKFTVAVDLLNYYISSIMEG